MSCVGATNHLTALSITHLGIKCRIKISYLMYCSNESGKLAPERIMKVKADGSYLYDFACFLANMYYFPNFLV